MEENQQAEVPEETTGVDGSEEPAREMTVVELSESMREELKWLEGRARAIVNSIKNTTEHLHDKGEVIADAMLALRHIEDARMRFGKCIQYATTGESNYTR